MQKGACRGRFPLPQTNCGHGKLSNNKVLLCSACRDNRYHREVFLPGPGPPAAAAPPCGERCAGCLRAEVLVESWRRAHGAARSPSMSEGVFLGRKSDLDQRRAVVV